MPRLARASPCLDSASTLLALPATIRHRRFGTVASFSTAPRAHGAKTSQGRVRISSGSTAFAPNSATTRSTALLSTSATINLAPSPSSSLHRLWPTWPKPCTATVRPSREVVPKTSSTQARIPCRTPRAVKGEGSPEPPRVTSTPTTWLVSTRIKLASSVEVPTSSATM